MTIVAIVLAVVAAALALAVWRLWRQVRVLRVLFGLAAPSALHAGLPISQVAPGLKQPRWKVVKIGPGPHEGKMGGLGNCPCQSDYTVATIQTPFAAMPNAAQIAAATANPPPVDVKAFPCPDGCVNVLTHVWHTWLVVQNLNNNTFVVNSSTFGQFHCKKPTDPDAGKAPKQGPPDPEPVQP
jgi:hypothetical protein